MAAATRRAASGREHVILRRPMQVLRRRRPGAGSVEGAVGDDLRAVARGPAPGQLSQHDRPALSLASRLGPVGEDAEQPRLQRRAPVEAIDAAEDGEPGLLDDILGRRLASHVEPSNSQQRRLVAIDEESEGRLAPAPQVIDEKTIVIP